MKTIMEYSFINAEKNKYAIYYAVYASYNIYADFDWNQMVDNVNVNDKNGFFIMHKEKCIGGFTLTNNEICHVFTIPPLSDRILLWKHILKYAIDRCSEDKIILNSVSEEDRVILTDVFNAKVIFTERRMF